MNILSKGLMCLGLIVVTTFVSAKSIKDHEELNLKSECRVVANNPNKMICNEHCSVFNRATGAPIGGKNLYWNCDSQGGGELTGWVIGYNASNAEQVDNCQAAGNDYHKALCDLNKEELIVTIYPNQAITLVAEEWNDCILSGTLCPSVAAEVNLSGNTFTTRTTIIVAGGAGLGGGSPKLGVKVSGPYNWVNSPTGADVSGNYNITPLPVYMIQNNNIFSDGYFGHKAYSYGFRACERANPSNCQSFPQIYDVFTEY